MPKKIQTTNNEEIVVDYAINAKNDSDGNKIKDTYAKTANLATVATSGSYSDLSDKPTIPTVGTLNTTAASAQSTSSSESFGGNITLHKVSKTGSYNDLLNKPTIPSVVTVTDQSVTSATTLVTHLAQNGMGVTVNKLTLADEHMRAAGATDKKQVPSSGAVSEYIASRGENLLTNGTFLMKNNYNFSNFTNSGGANDGYRGDDSYYCGGCVQITGSKSPATDELIAVDPSKKYELSYWIKCSDPYVTQFDWIGCYDLDGNSINANNIMYQTYVDSGVTHGVTTYLTEPLNDGDTVVHLADASQWKTSGNYNGFIFWDYKNSKGYQYPVEEYSRNTWNGLYEFSGIDKTNNTITLKTAWNKGNKPAGTYLSQNSSGGTYKYLNSGYLVDSSSAEALANNGWIKKTGTIQGVGKNNAAGKFFGGTAFVKIGYLINYANKSATQGDKNHAVTKLSSISFALRLPSTLGELTNDLKTITFNNSGSGVGSGTTYNGSTARTVSYNTIGAAPSNHASTATTYGLGASGSYGHVKVITGDLKDKTHASGYAASQAHTHSQYALTTDLANLLSGSGTSGYLAKFNGTSSLTNGPEIGTDTTTFLRNDGTWQVPSYSHSHTLISNTRHGNASVTCDEGEVSIASGSSGGIFMTGGCLSIDVSNDASICSNDGELIFSDSIAGEKTLSNLVVTANPSGTASTDLTKIAIQGTNYNIPTTKLYRHYFTVYTAVNIQVYIDVISTRSTVVTNTQEIAQLLTNGVRARVDGDFNGNSYWGIQFMSGDINYSESDQTIMTDAYGFNNVTEAIDYINFNIPAGIIISSYTPTEV